MKLTVDTAAEDLRSEADGAVGVPSLRVDTDETSHCGNRKEPQHWDLRILVPFKDLCNSMRNSSIAKGHYETVFPVGVYFNFAVMKRHGCTSATLADI